jgi:hypothetical protein
MLKYSPEGVLLSVKPFLFDSGMGATIIGNSLIYLVMGANTILSGILLAIP